MKRHRPTLLLIGALAGLVIAAQGASSLLASARAVDVVTVFAGAFGAGAALADALHSRKGIARHDNVPPIRE
jgi:hypothetical protein